MSKGVVLDNLSNSRCWGSEGKPPSIFKSEICDLKICLLIDGLDMFEGDQDEILILFNDVTCL